MKNYEIIITMKSIEELENELKELEFEYEKAIKIRFKEISICPFCETKLEGSDYIRVKKRFVLIKYSYEKLKYATGYCSKCQDLIFPDDYNMTDSKPWKDPESLFCDNEFLKKLTNKDIASGDECRDYNKSDTLREGKVKDI
jgi:hypothetical protein